jgi:hypothetical protein
MELRASATAINSQLVPIDLDDNFFRILRLDNGKDIRLSSR